MKDSFIAGEYDVVVVGAGHAGCEAAYAAARLGAKVALITLSMDNVALAPCNPSIGGPAKGVLVKEIDALGGAMGYITDKAQIQMRMLNTGKGPAVQALRAQIDKKLYQAEMTSFLQKQENIDLKQAEVEDFEIEDGKIKAVITKTGAIYKCKKVVLTTGTYMSGRIIMGNCMYSSGPAGLPAAMTISDSLRKNGVELVRFKTGTPARVDKKTLDFSKMTEQPSDDGYKFSVLTDLSDPANQRPKISCWLTYTNLETHKIIKDNMHRCPLYSGLIDGVGPRYCPSIEDKIIRFAHRDSHQLFLEPEGEHTDEYYVQGMSTSLPEDVQLAFMRTIPGMENVRIIRPAYAIEYDAVQPTQLTRELEMKHISGLYTAGQINGSSGYEEAAAQGLWAGANAALSVLGKEPFFLTRAQSYIGVLVDDLITKGVKEPYRMFTSLAEYRLLLRQDNADERLTEYAYSLGLVGEDRLNLWHKKRDEVEKEVERLQNTTIPIKSEILQAKFQEKHGEAADRGYRMWDLLSRPEFSYDEVNEMNPAPVALAKDEIDQVLIKAKYEGYIKKQKEMINRFNKSENQKIPADIDYKEIKALSNEAMQKLDKVKPTSIGQASRIMGVSPADISVLLVWIEKMRRSR